MLLSILNESLCEPVYFRHARSWIFHLIVKIEFSVLFQKLKFKIRDPTWSLVLESMTLWPSSNQILFLNHTKARNSLIRNFIVQVFVMGALPAFTRLCRLFPHVC